MNPDLVEATYIYLDLKEIYTTCTLVGMEGPLFKKYRDNSSRKWLSSNCDKYRTKYTLLLFSTAAPMGISQKAAL